MTEITVRHQPGSGAAVIEIRGEDVDGTRFHLRDTTSDKYLAKRGWTRNAAFLPAELSEEAGIVTLTLSAGVAGRIAPGATLALEQPGGFQQLLTWPTPDVAAIADVNEDASTAEEPVPQPLLLDSFEPMIMHDDLRAEEKTTEEPKTEPVFFAENDTPRSSWKPAAVAAALFLLIGMALGHFWLGPDSTTDQQSVTAQLEKQKAEFNRQLAEARQAVSSGALDKSKSADDQLAAARDAAETALAEKDKAIATLQKQLDDTNAQVAAVANAAGDKEKAQIDALQKQNAALNTDLARARGEAAKNDKSLRQAQGRLADAHTEIAALQQTASQAADAQQALAKELDTLKSQAAETSQTLAERERALKESEDKLTQAKAEVASVRSAADQQTTAQNSSLNDRIASLTTEVKASEQKLVERETALRDVQAKLSVANIQVDALKVVAGKSTEAGLESKAMSERLDRMKAELDKASQALSDREKALADATARLRETESKLAAASKRNDELATLAPRKQDPNDPEAAAADDAKPRLQDERDLYANELKTMTGNFTALQAQKAELEKTVASLQNQLKQSSPSTLQNPARAVWGATAIDTSGAIYSLQNQTAEKAAQENVTALCRGKSRSACEALATYSNACFSVARMQGEGPSTDNFAYFIHKDWKKASQMALERCQSMGTACTVRFTVCSPDGLSKPATE